MRKFERDKGLSMKRWLLLVCIGLSSSVSAMDTYYIDKKHSFVNFTIRHVVSKTSGTFHDVTGEIKLDPAHLNEASIVAKINLDSVNSSHAKRDSNIKAPKYLDVDAFGQATFVSRKVVLTGAQSGLITGDLTLHGVSKTLTMPFKVLGFGADPWGGQRAGFEASTVIKASDYGFTWMQKAHAPVGDQVTITLLIEGIKAKPEIGVMK